MKAIEFRTGVDLDEFYDTVSVCRGTVRFISAEGDALNLKSQLCRFLFSAAVLNKEIALKGKLDCEFEEDKKLLSPFFVNEV